MGRGWLLALPLLAACAANGELSLIERESLNFKLENERIRTRDLQALYEEQARKTDELSDAVLALERERDRLYNEYDRLSGEIADLKRKRDAAAKEKRALEAQLGKLRKENARLGAELDKERKTADAARSRRAQGAPE